METDLETVACAYRAVYDAGAEDRPAFMGAKQAYCAAHPGAESGLGRGRRVAELKPTIEVKVTTPIVDAFGSVRLHADLWCPDDPLSDRWHDRVWSCDVLAAKDQ